MQTQVFMDNRAAADAVAAMIEAGGVTADDYDVGQIVADCFTYDRAADGLIQTATENEFWESVEANLSLTRMTAGEFKRVRRALHFSQQHLADRLDVRRSTLSHWEMGKDPIPYRVRGELVHMVKWQVLALQKLVDDLAGS